jgi:ribosomal protein S27E
MVQGLMHTEDYAIECKDCGCLDVEVEKLPVANEWFPTGRAHCNFCGVTFAFRCPPTDDKEPEEEFGDACQYVEGRDGAVVYRPVRCPECRSIDVPVTHTAVPIRYHKCRSCGETFKSVEK